MVNIKKELLRNILSQQTTHLLLLNDVRLMENKLFVSQGNNNILQQHPIPEIQYDTIC